jgi:Lipocalin-like domain
MMTRLRSLTITSVAVLSLGITFSAKAQSLKRELVGSWSLVQNCEEFQDGKKNCNPLGPKLKGLLMFDANSFSFQMIGGDRTKTADPRTPVGPLVAYFGTYSTSDADKTLTYHIERASWPNFEGQDQKRIVTINGDEMSYKALAPINSPQGPFVPNLEFKRIK